jgi:subtilisin family serine protease
MKIRNLLASFLLILLFNAMSLFAAADAPDTDYKIDSSLLNKLTEDESATASFFLVFGERPDLSSASRNPDRAKRGAAVVHALQAIAQRSQAGVRGFLRGRNADFTPFWVENKIYVRGGSLELARVLAQRPEVVAILPEIVYTIPQPEQTQSVGTQAIGWNISKVRADQVWPTTTGAGIVVANIDTGVQYDHPALVKQYRGNTGSGFNHTGNWYDPTRTCKQGVPCDNVSHGTHTMGTMVGNDGISNQIGVAPGAKWIACKAFTTKSASSSDLLACAQWIMDPLQNGSGLNQPDVVNNSWGGAGGNNWYQSYVQNWKAAGIFPAFSNGNSGPSCSTSGSPGDYPESFASGATDVNDAIGFFSSRGPSPFGGIKPNIAAPGVDVRSSVPTNSYATESGTSMASPHTAAAVALLWAAAPLFRGQVDSTEQVLEQSAAAITATDTCGGVSAGASPNNTYGAGRLDALAAVTKARATTSLPPTVSITSPANGAAFNCPATVSAFGKASDPKDGDLSGSITWMSDAGAVFGTGGTASKSYACTEAGNHNITAKVTNSGGVSDTSTITVSIVNPNLPAAPSNLAATVNGSNVILTWTDNSSNESGFRLERKKSGGGSWTTINSSIGPATGTGSTVTYTDSPGKGNWQYRVSAFNTTYGTSAPSNVVSTQGN